MDEPYPKIVFGMKRRPSWLDAKFDILNRELKFLKLDNEYKAAPLKCQMEFINNLVRTLE